MSFKIDRTVDLKTAILINLKTALDVCTWTADPWKWLPTTSIGLLSFFNQFVSVEAGIWSSAANNQLREILVTFPGIASIGRRSNVESNNITSTPQVITAATQTAIRERSRFQISLVLNIFFGAIVYSTDPEWRQEFMSNFGPNIMIPKYMGEMLKKVRQGRSDNKFIKTAPAINIGRSIVSSNPGFKDTLIDPDFLLSQSGIRTYLDLCAFLHNTEGNYIPMVESDSFRININAGETITFTALTISSNIKNDIESAINAGISLLPGHSFGSALMNPVHLIDVVLVGGTLDNSTQTLNSALFVCSTVIEIGGTSRSFIEELVYRVTGVVPNSYPPDGKKEFDSDEGTETPAEMKRRLAAEAKARRAARKQNVNSSNTRSFNQDQLLKLIASVIKTVVRDVMPGTSHRDLIYALQNA